MNYEEQAYLLKLGCKSRTENKDAIEVCDGSEFICENCKNRFVEIIKLLRGFREDLQGFEFKDECFECHSNFDYFKDNIKDIDEAIEVLKKGVEL